MARCCYTSNEFNSNWQWHTRKITKFTRIKTGSSDRYISDDKEREKTCFSIVNYWLWFSYALFASVWLVLSVRKNTSCVSYVVQFQSNWSCCCCCCCTFLVRLLMNLTVTLTDFFPSFSFTPFNVFENRSQAFIDW